MHLEQQTSSRNWKLSFEILWAIEVITLIIFIYLRWPVSINTLATNEDYVRILTCGMFIFIIVFNRIGFYHRLNLAAFLINLLFTAELVIATAEAMHLLSAITLSVATTIYVLLIAIILFKIKRRAPHRLN